MTFAQRVAQCSARMAIQSGEAVRTVRFVVSGSGTKKMGAVDLFHAP